MTVKLTGLDRLRQRLKEKKDKSGKPIEVIVVGYTQSYALKVHEDLEMPHAQGKQAKYLEGPARQYTPEIVQIMRSDRDLAVGLLRAGLFLQRVSQEVVPVDTSALRASAFTSTEEDLETVAGAARSQSDSIRAASGKPVEEQKEEN